MAVSMATIQQRVAEHFGYGRNFWREPMPRSRKFIHARRIAYKLMAEQGFSTTQIGRHTMRNHTTVGHAIRAFGTGWQDTDEHRADYAAIREELGI